MSTAREYLNDLNIASYPNKYEIQCDGYLYILLKKTYKKEGDSLVYIGSEIIEESRSIWTIKKSILDILDTIDE